jgi:hypothetical protein
MIKTDRYGQMQKQIAELGELVELRRQILTDCGQLSEK